MLQNMPTILGELTVQNDVMFGVFSNKRYKNHCAYIVNQKKALLCKDLYKQIYLFEIIALHRPVSTYQNLHVYSHKAQYNLIGTNGQKDNIIDLLKVDYIPTIVKLI